MNQKDTYSHHDHSHCWEQDNPPCGQKIEHMVCCLCGKPNPKIFKIREEKNKP